MDVCYNKLFKLLIDKGMKKTDRKTDAWQQAVGRQRSLNLLQRQAKMA